MCSLRRREPAERCREHRPCLDPPESFMFLSGFQESIEMTDTEALGKDFTARTQQAAGGLSLKAFFFLFCHLVTFGFSIEELSCSGWYLDIM